MNIPKSERFRQLTGGKDMIRNVCNLVGI